MVPVKCFQRPKRRKCFLNPWNEEADDEQVNSYWNHSWIITFRNWYPNRKTFATRLLLVKYITYISFFLALHEIAIPYAWKQYSRICPNTAAVHTQQGTKQLLAIYITTWQALCAKQSVSQSPLARVNLAEKTQRRRDLLRNGMSG